MSLAEPYAVDNGGVVQLVGDDGVIRPQDGLEEAAVSVEAGGVEDAVVHLEEVGKLALQLLVDLLRAADEAYGGKAVAPLLIAGLGGGDDLGVVGKAEIVVGAHVENAFGLGGVDPRALLGGDDALLAPGTGIADGIELFTEDFVSLFHFAAPL